MSTPAIHLVGDKRKRKRNKWILLVCLLLVLAAGAVFVAVEFSVEEIEVTGIQTYSQAEVIDAVKNEDYVPNTLLMIAENRIFGQKYLPFIENIKMSYEDPHTLKIKVKEKLRAGVFEYMNKNVYFNAEGIAVETRLQRFDGVPVVTGVTCDKVVLGEEIPVEGDYFEIIVSITKKISTYGLDISEIHFESEDDITLMSGSYEIYLGSRSYLDGKMAQIAETLKSVSDVAKSGVIDMHLYTDEKNLITFHQ